MTVQTIVSETDRLMKKTLEKLHNDFATVRTNRVSAAILDPVRVNFYGSQVPIRQVGTVAVTDGTASRWTSVTLWRRRFDAELERRL